MYNDQLFLNDIPSLMRYNDILILQWYSKFNEV